MLLVKLLAARLRDLVAADIDDSQRVTAGRRRQCGEAAQAALRQLQIRQFWHCWQQCICYTPGGWHTCIYKVKDDSLTALFFVPPLSPCRPKKSGTACCHRVQISNMVHLMQTYYIYRPCNMHVGASNINCEVHMNM